MSINQLYVMAGAALFLAGCAAVGPDYRAPEMTTPVAEMPSAIEGKDISSEEAAVWWKAFHDPVMTELINQALSSNRTMRAAVASVREARARLRISEAGLLPTLDASGSYTRFRNSDNGSAPGHGDTYRAGFDVAWELDVFGRQRRSVEAAQAALDAEYASLEDVWVTLAAETALTYVELQTVRRKLDVAATNLLVQSQTLELVKSRAQSGISDELALEQSRYNMEQTRATIPSLQSSEEAALNALAVLVGVMPGELDERLSASAPIPEIEPRTLLGIPSDLLRRRPDVRMAERQLAAQSARIGVAEADLYPTFRLIGSVGLDSLESGDFFQGGSRFYSVGPGVSWPIFRGGSIRANIEVQNALQEQALANYEQTVLSAVAELRSALAAYGREYARRDALLRAQASAAEAVDIAQNQFINGISDFNSVLDAQRSLLSFGDQVANSDGLITSNLIRVYKALGGGWASLLDNEEAQQDSVQ